MPDVDVILRTIKDPTAVYLWQHLQRGGVKVVDPPEELPTGPGIHETATQRARRARRNSIHQLTFLNMQHGPMNICQRCVPM